MFKHKTNEKDVARFWSYVNVGKENECWEWTGTKDSRGYGIYSVRSVLYKAHRASMFFSGHGVPMDLVCCHSCDNPGCVNPNHLWFGTRAENTADRDKKGRTRTGCLRGEDNPRSKLTKEDVLFIRSKYNPKKYSTRVLARMFGVSQTKIRQILNREAWGHVK